MRQSTLRRVYESSYGGRDDIVMALVLGVGVTASAIPADFSRYEIRVPFASTIIDRHISLGEVHDGGSDVDPPDGLFQLPG